LRKAQAFDDLPCSRRILLGDEQVDVNALTGIGEPIEASRNRVAFQQDGGDLGLPKGIRHLNRRTRKRHRSESILPKMLSEVVANPSGDLDRRVRHEAGGHQATDAMTVDQSDELAPIAIVLQLERR